MPSAALPAASPPAPLSPPRLPPLEGGYITGTLEGGVANVALYAALLLLALVLRPKVKGPPPKWS